MALQVPGTDRDELRREATLSLGDPTGIGPRVLPEFAAQVVAVAGAARAPLFAVALADGTISLHRTGDGGRIAAVRGPVGLFKLALALDPDGRRLYASAGGPAVVWEAAEAGDWRRRDVTAFDTHRFVPTDRGM